MSHLIHFLDATQLGLGGGRHRIEGPASQRGYRRRPIRVLEIPLHQQLNRPDEVADAGKNDRRMQLQQQQNNRRQMRHKHHRGIVADHKDLVERLETAVEFLFVGQLFLCVVRSFFTSIIIVGCSILLWRGF